MFYFFYGDISSRYGTRTLFLCYLFVFFSSQILQPNILPFWYRVPFSCDLLSLIIIVRLQCPNLYTDRFQPENKLNTIVSENDRFHQELNPDQRHGSFWAHFQLVLDRTKSICSFWRRK